ncbi:DinB family protein [Spirosoma endophyticum]|uniref:DinB superfamily protein n=1 Tax=Spirosoma endophyticum TaxID=662367 RepID=A0A1I1XIB6_9BACT|nr:DinB family protein [Spirosoma endophyticum]SFE06941.1 DinB superfamily protein [Spirosoma endophyticum]
MHPQLKPLLSEIATARTRYISTVTQLTEQQAQYKPTPEVWSALENTEHLFWAEQGGIWGMWRALEAYRQGTPIWSGELTNRGRSIEDVIEQTWQPKETVPANAAPRLGGTLAFWCASLASLQSLLKAFSYAVDGEDLDAIIHPHPISGPLDIGQRFAFLRFHIDRHRRQIGALFTNDL